MHIADWLVNGLKMAKEGNFSEVNLYACFRHPDKNPDPDAERVFMDISEAYEVLMDDDLRAVFDAGNDVSKAAKEKRSRGLWFGL